MNRFLMSVATVGLALTVAGTSRASILEVAYNIQNAAHDAVQKYGGGSNAQVPLSPYLRYLVGTWRVSYRDPAGNLHVQQIAYAPNGTYVAAECTYGPSGAVLSAGRVTASYAYYANGAYVAFTSNRETRTGTIQWIDVNHFAFTAALGTICYAGR